MIWLLACTLPFPDRTFVQNPSHDYDGDGVTEARGDCDDAEASVFPSAAEVCDGLDNDCDARVDDADDDVTGLESGFVDFDGDGFGDSARPLVVCSLADVTGALAAALGGDCDDAAAEVNPGAPEVCGNGLDDDCDGSTGACGWEATNEMASADIVLRGGEDATGSGIAAGEDVDGDGLGDFAVGVPQYDASASTIAAGFVAVYLSGAGIVSGELLDAPILVQASEDNARLGFSLAWTRPDASGLVSLVAGEPSQSGATDYPGGAVHIWTSSYAYDDGAVYSSLTAGYGLGYEVADGGSLAADASVLVNAVAGGQGDILLLPSYTDGDWIVEDSAIATLVGDVGAVLGTNALRASDIDGDGVDDLIAGAHNYTDSGGGAFVVFHGPLDGAYTMADADLLVTAESGSLGRMVDAGDLDGDGDADLVASNDVRGDEPGLVFGFFDSTLRRLGTFAAEGDADFTLSGPAGEPTGSGLAIVGDVDGDDTVDLAVGTHRSNGENGGMYLVPGPFAGTSDLSDVGYRFIGEADARETGRVLDGLGDMNGDGRADWIVAAPAERVDGAVYVFFGREGP
jgi:hypothetical protein